MKIQYLIRLGWLFLLTIFIVWVWYSYRAKSLPTTTFTTDSYVKVLEESEMITFEALQNKKEAKLIFFPGSFVDPRAYAPLCRKMAQNGFDTHLIKMSFRLPQFDADKITTLFDFEKATYILAGHSKGGKEASKFIHKNPDLLKGLILLATDAPSDVDLSETPIPCLKLYGDHDGLINENRVLNSKDKLPTEYELVLIEGGNHSQFAHLKNIFGDDKAAISMEEQQKITAEKMVSFMNRLNE